MRKRLGIACMLLGLAMVIAAGWMLYDHEQAERAAAQQAEGLLESLKDQMSAPEPTAAPTEAPKPTMTPQPTESAQPTDLPEYMLLPAQTPLPIITPIPGPTAIPDMPTETIDDAEYIGYLEMPTIGISVPVRSEWSYPALKKAPCRYQGSAYDNTLIILAHNYDRHFGKIKDLEIGAPVQFVDVEGNVFKYVVAEHEILKPRDIDGMIENEYDLTLFTCTYGGASRVTVRLERVLRY